MAAAAKVKAAAVAKFNAAFYKGRPRAKKKQVGAAKYRRALRARLLAARRRALAARRLAFAHAARRHKKKSYSKRLIAFLVFLAVLPFVLVGLFLLGSDYVRRGGQRPLRKRRASLFQITTYGR